MQPRANDPSARNVRPPVQCSRSGRRFRCCDRPPLSAAPADTEVSPQTETTTHAAGGSVPATCQTRARGLATVEKRLIEAVLRGGAWDGCDAVGLSAAGTAQMHQRRRVADSSATLANPGLVIARGGHPLHWATLVYVRKPRLWADCRLSPTGYWCLGSRLGHSGAPRQKPLTRRPRPQTVLASGGANAIATTALRLLAGFESAIARQRCGVGRLA